MKMETLLQNVVIFVRIFKSKEKIIVRETGKDRLNEKNIV